MESTSGRGSRRGGILLPLVLAAYLLGCGTGMLLCRAGRIPAEPEVTQPSSQSAETTQPALDLWRPEAGEEWLLALVNAQNPLEADVDMELTQLTSGHRVDSRCYPDLQEMMDACREAGLQPVICSSYRSFDEQQALYNAKVEACLAQGCSQEEAQEKAAQVVAVPGTSEHHLGLSVDIVDIEYQLLDEGQEHTAVQKWLLEHCWEYGFILRYPSDKSKVTGIIYEPWHYRYVGREAARAMLESGLCLEEYLGQL